MMKKIAELKQERANLIKGMQYIVDTASNEKRSLNDTEQSDWQAKDERVKAIDDEVKTLERQESLNLSIVSERKKDNAETVAKRYNLGKAISEARNGNLSGLEAEMHQEAKNELQGVSGARGNLYIPAMMLEKRTENPITKTTGGNAGHISTQVGALDVVAPTPLYETLGATVYPNLAGGKLELPFAKGHTAGKVNEGASASKGRATKTKGTLTASRFQGYELFSQEYLAESAVHPAMLGDMVAAIDRAIGKELVAEAATANVLTGYTHTADAAATDFEGVLALMSALDNETFAKEGLVMSKELFYALAGTEKASNTAQFIIQMIEKGKGYFAGVDAYGTSFLPAAGTGRYQMVYGDWSRAFVGFWGGVQLLIDPYSASDDGEIKITFSRMADVAANPYAFASKRNVALSA